MRSLRVRPLYQYAANLLDFPPLLRCPASHSCDGEIAEKIRLFRRADVMQGCLIYDSDSIFFYRHHESDRTTSGETQADRVSEPMAERQSAGWEAHAKSC